jgi:hypothetical protein
MIGRVSDGIEERRVVGAFWTLVVSILLLPVILAVTAIIYTELVPAYSAEVYIKEIDATVAHKFYWVWDEMKNNGRYLTVRALSGGVTANICGFDWAHWARTSVYLTEDRAVAVLGPQQCDYIVRPPYRTMDRAFRLPSDHWTYLGAFDFDSSGSHRVLRFIPALEQRECIPMRGEHIGDDWSPRNGARKERCSQSALVIAPHS